MMRAKVLFVTSSVGLGHVTRDYRLSREIRSWADITWLTAGAAARYLEMRGERLHELSKEMTSIGDSLMHVIRGCRVRVGPLSAYRVYRDLRRNAKILREHLDVESFDLLVGDEPWELMISGVIGYRSALITDFESFRASGLISRVVAERVNSWLESSFSRFGARFDVGLWGTPSPLFKRPGNLFTHDGTYGEGREENLVVINLGGTDAAVHVADGLATALEKAGYQVSVIGSSSRLVPDPTGEIARARVLVTLAGYGSLVEAAAMRKRAVILRIDGHFEHEENARAFEGRKGYRILWCSQATPDSVLEAVKGVINETPDPPPVRDAAKEIGEGLRSLVEKP